MVQAMKDVFEKAINTAVGFVRKYLIYFIIIVIRILIILIPWMIEILGFGKLKLIKDKFYFKRV
jgi:hypothetical protein